MRDLLDFARPATSLRGKGLPAAEGSLVLAIEGALALLRPQKALRDVALEIDVPKDLPLVALAEDELVQIVLNLLFNAADAVPREGGRIALSASVSEGSVRVEIEDNGPGVAPEIQDRLFEPFTTTKEVGKGTGLGLAVCRGLLEAAGGAISLEGPTRSATGARFVFTAPVRCVDKGVS